MTHRWRVAAAAVLAAAVTACTVAPASGGRAAAPTTAPPPPPVLSVPAWESAMLARANAERAAVGARPLALCGNLRRAAAAHTADQAANLRMSHVGSDGANLTTRAVRSGYTGWSTLGENVAYGYANGASVMDGWMSSSSHRANLLNPTFTDVGFGQAADSTGTLYWTQDFGAGGRC